MVISPLQKELIWYMSCSSNSRVEGAPHLGMELVDVERGLSSINSLNQS